MERNEKYRNNTSIYEYNIMYCAIAVEYYGSMVKWKE
jgi:hypothetical protein